MKVIDEFTAVVGEGPLWSPSENAIFWLDTVEKKIFRGRFPGSGTQARSLPYRPSCLALLAGGGLLIGFKKGLGVFDFESGQTEHLELKNMSFEAGVFNDGGCDRAGRLWIGTMDRKAANPVGSLYRIGGDLYAHRVVDGFTVSNGIAWSPDGRIMYHADSRPGRIDAHDFDPDTGMLSNRRVFLDYSDKPYKPDGCTVDGEGGLWVAEIYGSRVARYAPDGRLDRAVMLPVTRPTSVMFGGANMSTLFITSMSRGLSAEDLAAQPSAGKLMAIDVEVSGLAEPQFAGVARGIVT